MAMYIDGKKNTLYKDDGKPAEMYKDGQKITGYHLESKSGANIVFENTYNADFDRLNVYGKSEQETYGGYNIVYGLDFLYDKYPSQNVWKLEGANAGYYTPTKDGIRIYTPISNGNQNSGMLIEFGIDGRVSPISYGDKVTVSFDVKGTCSSIHSNGMVRLIAVTKQTGTWYGGTSYTVASLSNMKNKINEETFTRISISGTINAMKSGDDDLIKFYVLFTPQFEEGVRHEWTVRNVMIEKGSTAHPYEPYVGGRQIPNTDTKKEVEVLGININVSGKEIAITANGIKNASIGNYTDSDGVRWWCDTVDLARGKYIKRVENIRILTINNITNGRQTNRNYYGCEYRNFPKLNGNADFELRSDSLLFGGSNKQLNGEQFTYVSTNGFVVIGLPKTFGSTLSAVINTLQTNPINIIVPIEPIETDIEKLQTTYPTTTIQSNTDRIEATAKVSD